MTGADFTDAIARARRQNSVRFNGVTPEDAADFLISKYTIQYTLTSVAASSVKLALLPGYFNSVTEINASRGLALDAIINEGDIKDTASTPAKIATGKGEPYPINELLRFVYRNPQCFTHLKLLASSPDQLYNNIEIVHLSPYHGLASDRLNPSMYKTANQTNDKMADIPLPDFQMDDQTLLYITLNAGASLTFIWSAGAQWNEASDLHELAKGYASILANASAGR